MLICKISEKLEKISLTDFLGRRGAAEAARVELDPTVEAGYWLAVRESIEELAAGLVAPDHPE